MFLQGIRLISQRNFELHDPLGEHTATLMKRRGRFGDIVIHFDTHEGSTIITTGRSKNGYNNEMLLFDVQIVNPRIKEHTWVINCASMPFRPLSMRLVPKGKDVEEVCFDVGLDEVLDLKVGEKTKNEIMNVLEEMGIDEKMARFIVDYGYFRSLKNDIFQVTNLIRFLGDEELLSAEAISSDGTLK